MWKALLLCVACCCVLWNGGCDDYEAGGGVTVSRGAESDAGIRIQRRGDPIEETRREIERLQRQGVPEGNVRITITRLEVEESSRASLQGLASYRDGGVTVASGPWNARNGVSFYAARPQLRQALRLGSERLRFAKRTEQFLVLMAGSEASFAAIERKRTGWVVVIPVWRGTVVIDTIEERITGSAVKARVHGVTADGADVELMPVFYGTDRNDIHEVEELSTRVTLRDGVPYVIASNTSETDSFGKAFFQYGGTRQRREVAYVLQIETGRKKD